MRYWPAYVVVLVLFNMIADVSARASRPWVAFFVYGICGAAWAVLLGQRGASLTKMVAVYGVLTYVLGALAGAWFFGERLSPLSWFGVALGLVGLALVSVGEYAQ